MFTKKQYEAIRAEQDARFQQEMDYIRNEESFEEFMQRLESPDPAILLKERVERRIDSISPGSTSPPLTPHSTTAQRKPQREFCAWCPFCSCVSQANRPTPSPRWQAGPAAKRVKTANRNEAADPSSQLQEMESSEGGPGATALQQAPLPNIPSHAADLDATRGVLSASPKASELAADNMAWLDQDQTLQETPAAARSHNHLELSNVRESAEEERGSGALDADADIALGTNFLSNDTAEQPLDLTVGMPLSYSLDDTNGALEQFSDAFTMASQDEHPPNERAYAKAVMNDGDMYVNTHDIVFGRNQQLFRDVRRQQKLQQKANQDLDLYRQEPSQHSQLGDDDQQGRPSNSSHSLEGRPAPPSNVSEHGGMLHFRTQPDGEVEVRLGRNGRRRYKAKSSSNNSIAPSSLHPSMTDGPALNSDGEPEHRTFAYVEIHPRKPNDITKISKEHIKCSFNFKTEHWELHVLGNGAFLNSEMIERGRVVPLEHGDEIMVATFMMTWKLPGNVSLSDGLSMGTFDEEDVPISDEDDADLAASPSRRLSNAVEAENSDGSDLDATAEGGLKKLKLKASKTKKDKKGKEKAEKPSSKHPKKDSPVNRSPESAKKAEKGKKPQAASKEPAEAPRDEKASPGDPQAQIEPGSALSHVPVDELPEKRKGPGRPPKNGLVSKRDQAMVSRRLRDYDKKGERPPPFDVLVAMVRRETKIRDAQLKALAANGAPVDLSVLPSIEPESGSVPKPAAGPSTTTETVNQTSATPVEPARKTSPKPKRTAKSPSPMKPEADCTEEELKKPNGTYVHLLNEVLENHPDKQADLQEIYDRIMKRWPYYKYRVTTTGWQSSVRHNLLQNERFMETGKSGKGKFWAINYEVSMEKEKKRKTTPPIKGPMQNGQFMPHPQFGQAQYGNPYAPHGQNGQPQVPNGPPAGPGGAYYSPYAQPGQHGMHAGQAQPGAAPNQYPPQPQHPQAQRNPDQPPPPAPAFQPLVEDIIQYQNRWLKRFPDPETQNKKREMFQQITNHLSDLFHSQEAAGKIMPTLDSDEAREVFTEMNALFKKHQDLAIANETKKKANESAANAQQQTVSSQVESGGAPEKVAPTAAPAPAQAPGLTQTDIGLRDAATAVKAQARANENAPTDTAPTDQAAPAGLPQHANGQALPGDATAAPPAPSNAEPPVPDTVSAPAEVSGIKREADDAPEEAGEEERQSKRLKQG